MAHTPVIERTDVANGKGEESSVDSFVGGILRRSQRKAASMSLKNYSEASRSAGVALSRSAADLAEKVKGHSAFVDAAAKTLQARMADTQRVLDTSYNKFYSNIEGANASITEAKRSASALEHNLKEMKERGYFAVFLVFVSVLALLVYTWLVFMQFSTTVTNSVLWGAIVVLSFALGSFFILASQ